jgi:hypothetical protein
MTRRERAKIAARVIALVTGFGFVLMRRGYTTEAWVLELVVAIPLLIWVLRGGRNVN